MDADGLSYLAMAPASIYLWTRLSSDQSWRSSARIYLVVMSVLCLVCPLYNLLIDAPMYIDRYRANQAAGREYFDFLTGLKDAATTRVLTHAPKDWGPICFG